MEGILTPFKSANVICTPNGVEATINIYANKRVYDLKPKTAVQIFYKDWLSLPTQGWRLFFDGFYSAIVKEDNATEGRMVAITCRDFRMDLRKAPAYLSYSGDQPLGTLNMYAMQGLYDQSIVKGSKLGSIRRVGDREYDNQLCSLSELMRYIAGTAYNPGSSSKKVVEKNKDPVSTDIPDYLKVAVTTPAPTVGYVIKSSVLSTANKASDLINNIDSNIKNTINSALAGKGTQIPDYLKKSEDPGKTVYEGMADSFQNNEEGKAKCGLFLDAFIRGLWSEAAGGTSIGVFTNKRIRMDKRFLVPSNRAGYNFWNRQSSSLEVGGYMMGDSRFTSLEAAIMRCAGLFSTRVYSCNTPTLIPISEEKAAHNPYSSDPYAADVYNKETSIGKVVDFIIDPSVRRNLVDNKNNNFGAKYILNESMLLPPMEFTAPPNCNIFLPPFCNRTSWQFDMDADITRGYYSVTDSMSGYDSSQGLNRLGVQVPNTLFDRSESQSSLYKGASKKDQYGRFKPPITLEERYKGVSLAYGQVNQDIAMNEVVAELRANPGLISKTSKVKINKIKDKAKEIKLGNQNSYQAALSSMGNSPIQSEVANNIIEENKQVEENKKSSAAAYEVAKESSTTNALRRHAIIKYLNEKYAGRVVTIDMMFNPYPMCGFPGMFIDDEEAGGEQSARTVIGMVQQVKHLIVINPNSAEASTTVLMNNARFIDEPTDMDADGNALYMNKTDRLKAEVNTKTLLYRNKNYHVADPIVQTSRVLNSQAYDMSQLNSSTQFFAKDFLSITAKSALGGRSNIYYLDKEYDPQHIPLFYKKVFQHNEDSFMIGREEVDFVYDSMHEAVTDLRAKRKDLMYDYDAAMKYVSRNVCSAEAFYHGILGLSSIGKDRDGDPAFINKDGTQGNEFDDSSIEDEYFGVTTEFYYSPAAKYLRNTDIFGSSSSDAVIKAKIIKKENAVQTTPPPLPFAGSLKLPPSNSFQGIVNEIASNNIVTIPIDEKKQYDDNKKKSNNTGNIVTKTNKPVPLGIMTGPGQFSSILETIPVTAFTKERKDSVKAYIELANQTAQGMRFTEPSKKV
jgi:hypothetical protein